MRATHFQLTALALVITLPLALNSGPQLAAQAPPLVKKPTAPVITARSPSEFLNSPREVVKTLYYSATAFDFRPVLMQEAIACLDLDPARAADQAESVRLVIELEQVLRLLCVPLNAVPQQTDNLTISVLDGEGFKIVLAKSMDGLWRFDRDTVARVPAMNRLVLARYRSTQAERAGLKDDLSDPSLTLRLFQISSMSNDFYAAARCLDLSRLDNDERSEKGPLLARKLAFVAQRRGWIFEQEVPNQPSGPPYTWHADKFGRIVLERVRQSDGKEAWLISWRTVRNIDSMYEACKDQPADPRYVRLGRALAPLTGDDDPSLAKKRPATVPAHLGSPRALLQGFFRVMDAAETKDAKLVEALEYLDLSSFPQADRRTQGTKAAIKLEAVLRKIRIELSALPDEWNAPAQILGQPDSAQVELVRQRDGCWRFSPNSVAQAPTLFEKVAAKEKSEQGGGAMLDTARDTMSTFLLYMRRGDYEQAAECLDLSMLRPGTQDEVGAVLAYKLKFIIDRIGRVYIQEVPDTAEGPRYVFYRGELGRIVIGRKSEGARKGQWLFTPETVAVIERMFRAVAEQPVAEASFENALAKPAFWQTPGLWLRDKMPPQFKMVVWRLQAYQWAGLALAVALCLLVSRVVLAQIERIFAFALHKCGSALTGAFLTAKLRSLTWVTAWWLLFQVIAWLDLPIRFLDAILPLKTFGMAALIALLGLQLVDLVTGIYTNSEFLRPHRSLSDMIVPVTMRSLKGIILLAVAIYVIYQIGEGDTLGRFLTGLGVAGLAASLAAQDALKNFFSTLLLIGERSFKIGDKITVGTQEGTVEQVGFRATRLRTADGSLLTIPNSNIASVAIDNRSTKSFSRCKMSLLVNYDHSADRILALREKIRIWLLQHPSVRQDKVDVTVNRLTDKGVEVAIDLYLTEVSGDAETQLRDEINCEVLRLCDNLGPTPPKYRHPLSESDRKSLSPKATTAA